MKNATHHQHTPIVIYRCCMHLTIQGRSPRGATGAFAPSPLFPERQEFYLYLNELLPQIVDLVVLTLGKYDDHTKAGNRAVQIADPTRARR